MLLFQFILIVAVYILAVRFVIKDFPSRLFVSVFTISTIYYGVLGPWYWIEYRDGYFLGVDWAVELEMVSWSFLLVHFFVLALFCMRSNNPSYGTKFEPHNQKLAGETYQVRVLFWLGWLAAIYVVISGGKVSEGAELTADPLLLIMLQASNLPIPVLLYVAASRGVSMRWGIGVAAYIAFAVMVGLRYKILLLVGPLLLWFYFLPRKNQAVTRYLILIGGIATFALFSVMTIARSKFSGLSLDAIADADLDGILFGAFADTNLIFGLASCFNIYDAHYEFVGFQPLIEVITQFVPRFLAPDKHLYTHLEDITFSLGNSLESLNAAVSIPFFGEYYAMFGWVGVAIGILLYSLAVSSLLDWICVHSVDFGQMLMGVGLLVLFFGYYYFSRGSMAQISKGFVFVCLPYLFLIGKHHNPLPKLKVGGRRHV